MKVLFMLVGIPALAAGVLFAGQGLGYFVGLPTAS